MAARRARADDNSRGSRGDHAWQTQLQDVVVECSFIDMGYSACPFAWDNYREAYQNVKVCPDRALGDFSFMEWVGGMSGSGIGGLQFYGVDRRDTYTCNLFRSLIATCRGKR